MVCYPIKFPFYLLPVSWLITEGFSTVTDLFVKHNDLLLAYWWFSADSTSKPFKIVFSWRHIYRARCWLQIPAMFYYFDCYYLRKLYDWLLTGIKSVLLKQIRSAPVNPARYVLFLISPTWPTSFIGCKEWYVGKIMYAYPDCRP